MLGGLYYLCSDAVRWWACPCYSLSKSEMRDDPPPVTSCSVDIPSEIDLGTVNSGATRISGSITGQSSCTTLTTMVMSLLSEPRLDGQTVNMTANGTLLGASPQPVGRGITVPLTLQASVPGALNNPGEFQTDAIIQVGFYRLISNRQAM